MASYDVRLKRSALKELTRVASRAHRRLLVRRIDSLAEDPRPPGCEKLTGRSAYRVRQGEYRIVYTVDDAGQAVVVVKIGHRRDVYR